MVVSYLLLELLTIVEPQISSSDGFQVDKKRQLTGFKKRKIVKCLVGSKGWIDLGPLCYAYTINLLKFDRLMRCSPFLCDPRFVFGWEMVAVVTYQKGFKYPPNS